MSDERPVLAGPRRQGVASVARDLLTLVKLQCQLAALDVKESAARIRQAVVLGAAGLTLAVASTVVGLVAAGVFLGERLVWPTWLALAVPAAAALVVAAGFLAAALAAVKGTIEVFSRSGEEFRQNIESVKSSLEGSEFAGSANLNRGE